jgi:monofunctional biosynthetic peptidoglycan transglycosylase
MSTSKRSGSTIKDDSTAARASDPADAKSERRQRPRRRRWAIAVLLAALSIVLVYHSLILFRVLRLKSHDPADSALMEQRAREAIALHQAPTRQQVWVQLEGVSPNLVRAVVAGEDPNFFTHSGFDREMIENAAQENWDQKRVVRGASTISQQLAKNLFLSTSRTPLRKLNEAVITVELEKILGKRRILELYLNVIEWGEGIYGAEAAAQYYFNKPAAQLSEEESAFLSAIIPSPRRNYQAATPPDDIRERAKSILALMNAVTLPNSMK